APKALVERIAELPGGAAVDARIARFALLDIPGLTEPVTGVVISLPEIGEAAPNTLLFCLPPHPGPPRRTLPARKRWRSTKISRRRTASRWARASPPFSTAASAS